MPLPGLWDGADVRWIGPERRRGGNSVRRGDRAVVVDAGRHHVGSFATVWFGPSSRGPVQPRRGVVIRIASGEEIRVARRHLEIVAPDHPLRPEPDPHVADWWLNQLAEWGWPLPIAAFVPRSLPTVCRVLHPWSDRDGHVRWDVVAEAAGLPDRDELATRLVRGHFGKEAPLDTGPYHEPMEGELDDATARSLIEVLSSATTSPNDVFFAVWVGWGDVPPQRFPGAARLETPGRGHFLLRGPIEDALTSISASRVADRPVSGLWWPADGAWFLATEIDFAWTFVAGTEVLVTELLSRDDLETMRTTHDSPANSLER